jgi:hypothetical protein
MKHQLLSIGRDLSQCPLLQFCEGFATRRPISRQRCREATSLIGQITGDSR